VRATHGGAGRAEKGGQEVGDASAGALQQEITAHDLILDEFLIFEPMLRHVCGGEREGNDAFCVARAAVTPSHRHGRAKKKSAAHITAVAAL
jgi:hypothetical protein